MSRDHISDAASFALRWAVMTGLWIALVGKTETAEVLAAAGGGLLAAIAGSIARRHGESLRAPPWPSVRGLLRLAWWVVRDIGVVARVVARQARRRRRAGGCIVAVPFEVEPGAASSGRGALAEFAGTLAAGTVVIGIDGARGRLLAHALEPDGDPDPLRLGGLPR
jgi:multisubunit Na+/H+ antiporter MnhE subunit